MLINKDDIMPDNYETDEFVFDNQLVRKGLDALRNKYCDYLADIAFSQNSKSHIAITTFIQESYDRILNTYRELLPARRHRVSAPQLALNIPDALADWII